jgi:hypothetical protein
MRTLGTPRELFGQSVSVLIFRLGPSEGEPAFLITEPRYRAIGSVLRPQLIVIYRFDVCTVLLVQLIIQTNSVVHLLVWIVKNHSLF